MKRLALAGVLLVAATGVTLATTATLTTGCTRTLTRTYSVGQRVCDTTHHVEMQVLSVTRVLPSDNTGNVTPSWPAYRVVAMARNIARYGTLDISTLTLAAGYDGACPGPGGSGGTCPQYAGSHGWKVTALKHGTQTTGVWTFAAPVVRAGQGWAAGTPGSVQVFGYFYDRAWPVFRWQSGG